jgi:hypothetical protein
MGAGLPLYLAVSWPIGFLGVSAVILLGDSVVTGRPTEALLALALLLPLIWVGYRYRHLVNAAVPGISKFLPTQGLAPPPALLPHAPRVGTVSADRCKTGGQ